MTYLRTIVFFCAALFTLAGCEDEVSNEMTSDYPENFNIEYQLRQVMQYDPVNINGLDVSDKLDFFSTLRFSLQYTNGEISKLTYSNGTIPFSPFAFDTEMDFEADCELVTDVLPNELRIKGTDQVIAYFQNGEFIMPFQLDCSSIRYRYTFVNVN